MRMLLCLVMLAGIAGGAVSHALPSPRGVLDGVITGVINGLRPDLAGLVLPDLALILNASAIVANLTTTNITTDRLDFFNIDECKTTLLPLRLDQLTLTWDEISLAGPYSLNGDVTLDVLQGPVHLTGAGNASLVLRNLTLQLGATINSPEGHLQVKDITQLSVQLGESEVILENIFDGGDMETIINVFLGFFLTEFINDSGDSVLEQLQPIIKDKINEILANVNFP